jgi:hypothetical protein
MLQYVDEMNDDACLIKDLRKHIIHKKNKGWKTLLMKKLWLKKPTL